MARAVLTTGPVEVLEKAESRLVRRYRAAAYSHDRLTASEKLWALVHRFEDPQERRRLIQNYLPLAYRLARRVKGGCLMRKIEMGNLAILKCLNNDSLRPEDDVDYLLSRQILSAIRQSVRS